MTQEEERALNLFIQIIAELNDAQEAIERELKSDDSSKVAASHQYNAWTSTFRCGESQESLNNLVLKLIELQEE